MQFLVNVILVSADRSSSGLVEYNNRAEALGALVMTNHFPVPNPGKISHFALIQLNSYVSNKSVFFCDDSEQI